MELVPPVAVVDDFLDRDTLDELTAWTLARETAFEPTRIGRAKLSKPGIRASNSIPNITFDPWRERIRAFVTPWLPTLATDAGVTPFDPERLEVQLVAHNDGDYYVPHIDTAVGGVGNPRNATRALSIVYYFHAEPRAFTGGALRVHSFLPSSDATRDIEPLRNRLVAFIPWARHEVLPIACPSKRFADSRFSINIWAHRTKDAPS